LLTPSAQRSSSGVIVTDVADNSLAAQQDVQREDIITEVDGQTDHQCAIIREALNKADPDAASYSISIAREQNFCCIKSRHQLALGASAADRSPA